MPLAIMRRIKGGRSTLVEANLTQKERLPPIREDAFDVEIRIATGKTARAHWRLN